MRSRVRKETAATPGGRKTENGRRKKYLPFPELRNASLAAAPAVLRQWLPDGKAEGREYKAKNPRRADNRPGSFSVNMHTGKWADFATGDKGGDLISLAAYLFALSYHEAAESVAAMLGMEARQ
ncbi:MAG: hypothetical protein ABW189_08060 [Rickettsiales bacterium]